MKVNCKNCGLEINLAPSKIRKNNYCSRECHYEAYRTKCNQKYNEILPKIMVILSEFTKTSKQLSSLFHKTIPTMNKILKLGIEKGLIEKEGPFFKKK